MQPCRCTTRPAPRRAATAGGAATAAGSAPRGAAPCSQRSPPALRCGSPAPSSSCAGRRPRRTTTRRAACVGRASRSWASTWVRGWGAGGGGCRPHLDPRAAALPSSPQPPAPPGGPPPSPRPAPDRAALGLLARSGARPALQRHRTYAAMARGLAAGGGGLALGGVITQGLRQEDLFYVTAPHGGPPSVVQKLQASRLAPLCVVQCRVELGAQPDWRLEQPCSATHKVSCRPPPPLRRRAAPGGARARGRAAAAGRGRRGTPARRRGAEAGIAAGRRLRVVAGPTAVPRHALPRIDAPRATGSARDGGERACEGRRACATRRVQWRQRARAGPGPTPPCRPPPRPAQAPQQASAAEVAAEVSAVRRAAAAACPIRAVLERVVATSSGVLVACWQVGGQGLHA
jgi:hypothetical protein